MNSDVLTKSNVKLRKLIRHIETLNLMNESGLYNTFNNKADSAVSDVDASQNQILADFASGNIGSFGTPKKGRDAYLRAHRRATNEVIDEEVELQGVSSNGSQYKTVRTKANRDDYGAVGPVLNKIPSVLAVGPKMTKFQQELYE